MAHASAEQINSAMKELREVGNDGPRARKLLDALFRSVHNLKARAAADGLSNLATAAHEFENVLHSLRTGGVDAAVRDAIPGEVWDSLKQEQRHAVQQSLAEGARLFLVQASFDVADFDREFQRLKARLSETGEVISTSARIDKETPGKINFQVLYTRMNAEKSVEPDLDIEEIVMSQSVEAARVSPGIEELERCFEKLSAEFVSLPGGNVWQRVVRAGQAAAVAGGKEVDFEVRGEDLELDDSIADALLHLVRNAVDHGIESRGKVTIEAQTLGDKIKITVTDDGRGIDPPTIDRIFNPGFSTATELTEISGRGVGLDAVKSAVQAAGGSITVTSQPNQGSTFQILLPR